MLLYRHLNTKYTSSDTPSYCLAEIFSNETAMYYRGKLLLAVLPAVGRLALGCNGLERNLDTCPAKTYAQEYICLMKQNTLKSLMDCVNIDSGSHVDNQLCRKPDDGIFGNGGEDDYFDWSQNLPSNRESKFCSTPRKVILAAASNDPCRLCSFRGLLESCPMNDPDFHNCLCEHNIQNAHFQCLSRCFKPGGSLSCSTFAKRGKDSTLEEIELPPIESIKLVNRAAAVSLRL